MKKILDLKRKAYLNKENRARLEETIEFMEWDKGYFSYRNKVLDIGPANLVGWKIAEYFAFQYNYTSGDLNYPGWSHSKGPGKETYDKVLCFEVIEHLMNPLLFFEELKRFIDHNSLIYISYPFHYLSRHWGNHHFHEMDEWRFLHLINEAGYRVIDRKKVFYKNSFWRMFRGIRPIFRYFSFWWVIKNARRYYYILELK